MNKISFKRLIAVFICVFAVSASLSSTTYASDTDMSLTVKYSVDGEAAEGVFVSIYRIAEITSNNKFKPLSPYKNYPMADLNTLDTVGLRSAAYTYAGYVASDKLSATASGSTDTDGCLCLSNIPDGLYLVIYNDVQLGESRYSAAPTLVSLRGVDNETNTWNNNITINAKPSESATYTKVIKIWKNDNSRIRPTEISVQLYRRPLSNTDIKYEEYGDPIVLNKENNWQHVFEVLPNGYEWQIKEVKVPEHYNVSIIPQGTVITVTNDCPSPPPLENLPSTGSTWYLVTPLICIGLGFIVLGLFFKKREE